MLVDVIGDVRVEVSDAAKVDGQRSDVTGCWGLRCDGVRVVVCKCCESLLFIVRYYQMLVRGYHTSMEKSSALGRS